MYIPAIISAKRLRLSIVSATLALLFPSDRSSSVQFLFLALLNSLCIQSENLYTEHGEKCKMYYEYFNQYHIFPMSKTIIFYSKWCVINNNLKSYYDTFHSCSAYKNMITTEDKFIFKKSWTITSPGFEELS